MTATDYIEKGITPVKGGVVWSPHHYILSRGYGHVHTILNVEKKKRGRKPKVKEVSNVI